MDLLLCKSYHAKTTWYSIRSPDQEIFKYSPTKCISDAITVLNFTTSGNLF